MTSGGPKKILILCRANGCRSQMAAAFLERLDDSLIIKSAGTNPIDTIHPFTIKVMKEKNLDISNRKPVDVRNYINEPWDYLITVCDVAKSECPAFHGNVKRRVFYRFVDPLEFTYKEPKLLNLFRNVRDNIEQEMKEFCEIFISKK